LTSGSGDHPDWILFFEIESDHFKKIKKIKKFNNLSDKQNKNDWGHGT